MSARGHFAGGLRRARRDAISDLTITACLIEISHYSYSPCSSHFVKFYVPADDTAHNALSECHGDGGRIRTPSPDGRIPSRNGVIHGAQGRKVMKYLLPMVLGTLLFAVTPLPGRRRGVDRSSRTAGGRNASVASRTQVAPRASGPAPPGRGRPGEHVRAGDDATKTYYTFEQIQAMMTTTAKKYAWTKGDFTITPYGFLWANMVYETERSNDGDYTLYVYLARDPRRQRLPHQRPGDSAGLRRGGSAAADLQLRAQRRQGRTRLLRQFRHREQARRALAPCLLGSQGRRFPPLDGPDLGRDLAVVSQHDHVFGVLGARATSAIAGRSSAASAF